MSGECEFLDAAELRQLTGSSNRIEQVAVLIEQGIPHRVVGKRILVSRHHTREWLAGKTAAPARGIRWDKVT